MQLAQPNMATLDIHVAWTSGWPTIFDDLMRSLPTEFGCTSALRFDVPRCGPTFHTSYSHMAPWIPGSDASTHANILRNKCIGVCSSTKFCETPLLCYSQQPKSKRFPTELFGLTDVMQKWWDMALEIPSNPKRDCMIEP